MRSILAFCFFPAFVPPSNGGQSRLFNFYKALSKSFNITLLTSTHVEIEEEVVNHGVGFIERRIPKDQFFIDQWEYLSDYSGGGDLSGPCTASCGKFPTRLHQAYMEEYEKADVIIHDFPFTIEYDLFAGLDNKLRVYNAHNCETLLYKQLHDSDKSIVIHEVVRQAELRMLEVSDLLFYCSEENLKEFSEMAPTARFNAVLVPHGMTPLAVPAYIGKTKENTFSVVFMGSGHPPNVEAAEFIVNYLAPKLPEVTFDIIGSCLLEGKYPSNVHLHGVVSDDLKSQLLRQANLALNPMISGSGSNVKVLDYLSYGLPVLSTSFGMRGIRAEAGKEYLEASLEHFLEVIQSVASDTSGLVSIALAGYDLAFTHFTWEAIAHSAVLELEKAYEVKVATASKSFVLVLNDYDSFEGIGGGSTRTQGLYAAISDWSPVLFISFSSSGCLQLKKPAIGITTINVPKSYEHSEELQRANALFHVAIDDVVASQHCQSNYYLNVIYRVLRQSARCIIIEHCYMAALPCSWGDRFVYSSQNNETELKKRILEWHPLKTELLQDVERIEQLAVECSATVISVSQEDAESLVRGKQAAGPVIVVRNGATVPETSEEINNAMDKIRGKVGDRAVVFLGSAHMPNVEAAQYLAELIAPECDDIVFHIIGAVCNTISAVPANVVLWGVVDDVTKNAVMQSCELAVNPMLSGSGSNVKLADYLGNGLFVLTTEFGQRGYPDSIQEHIEVTSIDKFAGTIRLILSRPELFTAEMRLKRRELFDLELAMKSIAKLFLSTLQGLETKKKRVLYVAYRYTAPPQGGAEVNIEKFVRALGYSGHFDVDVVAPEVSGIHSNMRFSETYTFDIQSSAPVDIPNVRFARFPADTPSSSFIDCFLQKAWRTQPRFEKALSRMLADGYEGAGLTWGWGYPEVEHGHVSRWAFAECGVFLADASLIQVIGYAPVPVVVTVQNNNRVVAGPTELEGHFHLHFQTGAGEVEFSTSTPVQKNDPRPIAFLVSSFTVASKSIDLSAETLVSECLAHMDGETTFKILDQAATETRGLQNVRLTDGRGPWSASLEQYISDHVSEYDLVITHNNVFRPAVVAIEEARIHGVPSILIPHAHLDDDFYHFPDLLESARNASVVLAVPKVACEFLASKGCTTRYMSAGCDIDEKFSPEDVESFKQVFSNTVPFILVLGRKAGAKGYRKIITAAEQLTYDGTNMHVVIIGPDDDGLQVDSPSATYLGRQPRNVVRGALMSCVALCNMSTSESFGIVLLEAWLAGKPVIVNRNCAAFHDMVIDRVNGLMVSDENLAAAMREILSDDELRARLAKQGRTICAKFAWQEVCKNFVSICNEVIHNEKQDGDEFVADPYVK